MDRDAVRAFANRDWDAVRRAKDDYWARADPDDAIRVARALWRHARNVRPEWPTPEDRAVDLEHHVGLKALIDRAGRALARR